MNLKQRLEGIWNRQYRSPGGLMGRLAGARMVRQHKPETAWTIDLLEIQPADTVLEVGFGAGQGIKLAAEKASDGHVMAFYRKNQCTGRSRGVDFPSVNFAGAGDASYAAGGFPVPAFRAWSGLPPVHERGSYWREVAFIPSVVGFLQLL